MDSKFSRKEQFFSKNKEHELNEGNDGNLNKKYNEQLDALRITFGIKTCYYFQSSSNNIQYTLLPQSNSMTWKAFVAESFFVRHVVYLMATTHYMLYNVTWGLLSAGRWGNQDGGEADEGLEPKAPAGFSRRR